MASGRVTTVSTPSLQDNRNVARVWVAEGGHREIATAHRVPGWIGSPRWSPDGRRWPFISTREEARRSGCLPVAAVDARKSEPSPRAHRSVMDAGRGKGCWSRATSSGLRRRRSISGTGTVSDDARPVDEPPVRHWDDWRAGKRQQFSWWTSRAEGDGSDALLTIRPTIATGGDGDVAVSPGRTLIAFAMHATRWSADIRMWTSILIASRRSKSNTGSRRIRGADNYPRFLSRREVHLASVDGARGFEADRQRFDVAANGTTEGRKVGNAIEATRDGICPSAPTSGVRIPTWSTRLWRTAGRDNNLSHRHSVLPSSVVVSGASTPAFGGADNARSSMSIRATPSRLRFWVPEGAVTPDDSAVPRSICRRSRSFGFVGALGDSVFGWTQKPPRFDAGKKYRSST